MGFFDCLVLSSTSPQLLLSFPPQVGISIPMVTMVMMDIHFVLLERDNLMDQLLQLVMSLAVVLTLSTTPASTPRMDIV